MVLGLHHLWHWEWPLLIRSGRIRTGTEDVDIQHRCPALSPASFTFSSSKPIRTTQWKHIPNEVSEAGTAHCDLLETPPPLGSVLRAAW